MKSRRIRGMVAGSALILVALFAANSEAAPISGTLNGTGSFVLTNGVVTFTNAGPVGGGIFVVDPSSTGFWATLVGTTAIIQPINSGIEPPGAPVNVPNWMTFNGAPTVSVTLNLVLSGIYTAALCGAAPAAGQSCTPPGTPFNFTNVTATSSTVSFAIQGTVVNSAEPGQTSAFTGLFTAQFALNYQALLATLGGGGAVPTTYSAGFVATPSGITTPTPTPTPTPSVTITPTNTPTTVTVTPTNTPATTPNPALAAIPMLSPGMFGLLVASLAALAVLLLRGS